MYVVGIVAVVRVESCYIAHKTFPTYAEVCGLDVRSSWSTSKPRPRVKPEPSANSHDRVDATAALRA